MTKRRTLMMTTAGAALALVVSGMTPAIAGHAGKLETVYRPLNSARGVDALGDGLTLVTEGGRRFSTFSLVDERNGDAKKTRLGRIRYPFAPSIAAGEDGTVWIVTGENSHDTKADNKTAARLYKWREGWKRPRVVANIGRYQKDDPDPYNLAESPGQSNPFGLEALDDGSLLVADAANNDLLHVSEDGDIETVARFKPRKVRTPKGLPDAGKKVWAEAVSTSVTVGDDGYWYVGELRGYPATAGTSEIWRIRPGTTDAVCNPRHAWRGDCKRFADGLTSIVDLGADEHGIYAVTLSKKTWLALEAENPKPKDLIGGLFLVRRDRDSHKTKVKELVKNKLTLPSGVDVAEDPYVVGPIFGPGSLKKID